jgi:hypothetical protein
MSETKENPLKEAFAALENTAKELKNKVSKADMCEVTPDNFKYLCSTCDNLYNMIYNLRDAVYQGDSRVWDAFYQHQQNHVPKLDAGAMEKFLKVVGLSDSYEVIKPSIYISASKNGNKTFNVDLGKFSKN